MSEVEWMKIFSGNLKSLMEETGMTQSQLAEAAHLDKSTISTYVNCVKMPSVRSIVNLAYALDCSVVDLTDFGDMID